MIMDIMYRLTLLKDRQGRGFTLLELLIVIFMASILLVISMPTFMGQVGKARDSEVKNAIGTINRSQEAYHWERRIFAQGTNDQDSLLLLNLSINSKYITSYNILGDSVLATVAPINENFAQDQTKGYSGGVFFIDGDYPMIICQSLQAADSLAVPTSSDDCGVGVRLR
jgi:prepilin-type N-terminal cleavage/methylation domain-containing protein